MKRKRAKPCRSKTRSRYPDKFPLHTNVMALWPDENGEPFRAQIFGRYRGKYNLYFPSDGEVLKGVKQSTLQTPPKDVSWAKLTRKQFLELEFLHKKHVKNTPRKFGTFKVMKLGKGVNVNKYVCMFGDAKREYLFDMGYVQNLLIPDIFPPSLE